MFVVDTNVLVHAAALDSPFHGPCRKVIEEARSKAGAWYLTWSIAYEFLRVMTHRNVLKSPVRLEQAWDFLTAVMDSPGLGMLVAGERHRAAAAEVFAEMPALSGNIVHDAHTAVLMREHGVSRIYTRDADFFRFRFLEVIDPAQQNV